MNVHSNARLLPRSRALLVKAVVSERHGGHLHILRIFTKPYTPKTNGKAERFIQASLREWAYAAPSQDLTFP